MKILARLCLPACLALASLASVALAQTDHAASIARLKTFRFGDDQAALDVVAQQVNQARSNPDSRRQIARELAEVLRSDASFDAKQFVCRELVLIAGEAQVPALAALLRDEALAHYALLVLARIPGPAVDEALRRELPRSPARVQIEIINALGERRDNQAVLALAEQLRSPEAAIVEAAAAALGKIGDARAVAPLRQAYESAPAERRPIFGRALLQSAEHLRLADAASALSIYEMLSRPAAHAALRAAALRGLGEVNGPKALPRLLEALGEDGSPLQAMAVDFLREMPGRSVTEALAARLPTLSGAGQLLLLAALSDRGDARAAPAIEALCRTADGALRTAALEALGRIGDDATVPFLLQVAARGEPGRSAARAALTRLPGRAVDAKLLALLGSAPAPLQVQIIDSLGARRVAAAVPRLVKEVGSRQPTVSAAVVRVLRDMGQPPHLPALLAVLATSAPNQRAAVLSAASEIARRGADENQRSGAVLSSLSKAATPAARAELLTLLGQIGGPRALQALRKAVADTSPEVKLSALRQLAEWPTDEPLNDLLQIARTAQGDTQRTLALRGTIQMIGMDNQRSPEKTLALYGAATALSKSVEAKRLVLAGVAKHPSLAALDYARGLLADPQVRAEAEFAIVQIGRGTAGAWREQTRAALAPIAQGSPNQNARDGAREVLALLDKFGDFVTAWEVSPPYERESAGAAQLFDLPFAPEISGRDQEVAWRLMPAGTSAEQPWLLDLLALWGGEQRVAYLRSAVWSESAREVVLELGSDDGARLWWNGAPAFANNVMRAVAPGQDKVRLQMKPGWNQLMLKITQNNMGWAACARFTNADGSPVSGLRYLVPSALVPSALAVEG